MNAYTTDLEDITNSLQFAEDLISTDSYDLQTIGNACSALCSCLNVLIQRVDVLNTRLDAMEAMREDSRRLYAEIQALKIRLDELEDATDTIEQEIGLAAYENGEDHL